MGRHFSVSLIVLICKTELMVPAQEEWRRERMLRAKLLPCLLLVNGFHASAGVKTANDPLSAQTDKLQKTVAQD